MHGDEVEIKLQRSNLIRRAILEELKAGKRDFVDAPRDLDLLNV
jgi:hypothetical protein